MVDVFINTNMAEPTLEQVFGTNTTQDATTVTFNKADLIGLTASANNSAESILVSLNLTAKEYLTEANFESNLDQSIYYEEGLPSFLNRGENSLQYRTDQLTMNLAKVDADSGINPDNY